MQNTPDSPQALQPLDHLDGYRRSFLDASLWAPFVRRVCRDNQLGEAHTIRPGAAGTFPTFIVNERWVVKFFGWLLGGLQCWQVERAAAEIMDTHQPFPTARLLRQGLLFSNHPAAETPSWSYLVFEFLPGAPISEVFDQLSCPGRLELAHNLGEMVRNLHEIRLPPGAGAALPNAQAERQRMRPGWAERWQQGGFPAHLVRQAVQFLDDCERLSALSPQPHLIHADLTRDHLLGSVMQGRWALSGVIDFGDAMLGGLDYELAALHLDLFDCDREMLGAFLRAYQLPGSDYERLPHLALRAVLLHQFIDPSWLLERQPWVTDCASLEELARRMWEASP
jgi:hygromycin-B 7''-O-kinase